MFKLKFLLSLIVIGSVLAIANAGYTAGANKAADGDWTLKKGDGGPEISTSFTNLDSIAANSTYTAFSPKPATFDAQTMWLNTYFNGGANDSLLVIVQAKPFGVTGTHQIVNVDTLYIVGASTPAGKYNSLSLSGYGGEYRLKINAYTSGGGTTNSAGNDLEITWGSISNDPYYSRPAYNANY